MKKYNKETIDLLNIKPENLEYKEVFIRRFCNSFDSRAFFRKKLDRILIANQIWDDAKKNSIVSINTSKEQYYLFN